MQFKLQIVSSSAPQWLTVEAADLTDAIRRAQRSGYRVLSAHDQRSKGSAGRHLWRPARLPLLLFTQELVALLDAGMNVVEALQTLCRKERNPDHARVLDEVLAALIRGHTLSEALSTHEQTFPPIYVASVRASERSGGVVEALTRFIAYQEQVEALRNKMISASIYPVVLVVAATAVTLFLLGVVVPEFAKALDSAHREIPTPSRYLLHFGRWLSSHWGLVGAAMALGLVALAAALWDQHVRTLAVRWALSLPLLRARSADYARARLYHTIAVLLDSGTPLLKALEICAPLMPPKLESDVHAASQGVRSGASFSESAANTRLFTPIAESLVRAGERSGRLSDMLSRSARLTDEGLRRFADRATQLATPVIMVVMGVIIGMIVVSLYLALASVGAGYR